LLGLCFDRDVEAQQGPLDANHHDSSCWICICTHAHVFFLNEKHEPLQHAQLPLFSAFCLPAARTSSFSRGSAPAFLPFSFCSITFTFIHGCFGKMRFFVPSSTRTRAETAAVQGCGTLFEPIANRSREHGYHPIMTSWVALCKSCLHPPCGLRLLAWMDVMWRMLRNNNTRTVPYRTVPGPQTTQQTNSPTWTPLSHQQTRVRGLVVSPF
jgi:hypothetical protein